MSSSSHLDLNKDDFLEYFSEEKPEPITKVKTKTFKELKKIAMNRIHKRYGANAKLKYQYIGLIMENLIFNKNTHLVSTFKDYMIWDYVEEFLKRYYNDKESGERVPKFALFYKNYLKFFCIPTFKDIFSNEMIHNFNEKKAELFYNENYKKKKETNSYQEDCGIYEESESDEESDSKTMNNNIEKTIFNETVKKKIERYSPINTSMALPESDTKLKPDDSGLLVTSSNESSLVNIMKGMIPPPPPVPKIKKSSKNNNNNKKSVSHNNNNKNNNKSNNKSNDNNSNINSNNHQGENSSSYRQSQKNLMSSTLNKFNSKTLEALLHSQMKFKSKNSKIINKKNNVHSKDTNYTNSNNVHHKNKINNVNNKNKIISYMGIYKKKSIPKSRNENKLSEEAIKTQTKSNNFMSATFNVNNNHNYNGNTINIKSNLKNITSINNYNLNYKQSLQKSRNPQQSISINSNTYSKYSVDKINNMKKKGHVNLFKNNNIEYILNQLKVHPFCTLKKSATKKVIHNNSNNENKKEQKRSKILSAEHDNGQNRNDNGRNSVKSKTINNNKNNDVRPYSHNNNNHKCNNSPSSFDYLNKPSNKLIKGNINIKTNIAKDAKLNKKSRNFSYNENQKSDYEEKNKNRNNINNNKMSFDGVLNNRNNNKKSNTINNNGTKHIHNVNININSQINIGGKQFNELFSFTDLVKKNNIINNNKNIYALLSKNKKNNFISRNKNQSLDFNQYTNNPNNNANSIGSNKMDSISEMQNGNKNMYKTQFKSGFPGTINNNKNRETKKIKLTNNALFRSMKSINNNRNNKF